MDLFASRMNHQPPVYCTWRPDPGALAVDGFSISWAQEFPYLFPPFCLIGRALSKIQRDSERGSHVRMLNSTSMANSGVVPTITCNADRPSNPSSRPRRSISESRSQTTPRYTTSWDVREVVGFLSGYKSATLSTLQLGKKAVTLLALVNADRCSDLAVLDRNRVRWTFDGLEFTAVQLTKTRSK